MKTRCKAKGSCVLEDGLRGEGEGGGEEEEKEEKGKEN